MPIKKYTHQLLDEQIDAIGGHYVVSNETRFPYQDQEVFYISGHGVVDTSCCGPGGCLFVTVLGSIVNWKKNENEEGVATTEYKPIRDEQLKKTLRDIIQGREPAAQINFI